MKFLTYLNAQNQERVGLRIPIGENDPGLAQANIIDLHAAHEWLANPKNHMAKPYGAPPSDVMSVIREPAPHLAMCKQLLTLFRENRLPAQLYAHESKLRVAAPLRHPLSVRDGYAFKQHVEAARRNRGVPMIPEFDHFPVFYFTNHLAVTGPGEVNVQKLQLDKLDYELEVAIVIGKEGRNIPAAHADEHIFGYMIMNDWSARGLQMEEMKMNLGPAKGKDFASSFGPYLVTRDELAPHAKSSAQGERFELGMRAFVNGKKLSEGNLKDMHFTFAQIVERASYGVTLHAGEVIGSGTVGTGCLLELNGSKITHDLWLKPGDVVALEVDQLGRLENTIVEARA